MKHEEDNMQIRFMNWMRKRARDNECYKIAHHCPNGGKRGAREGARFKLMGVIPGIPDVDIPVPNPTYYGLYIEFKTKKGRVSDAQKEVHRIARLNNRHTAVCRSCEEAIEIVEKYERDEL